ncbi:MAG: hypothetical protein IT281_04890 [Ignavibacteria bacterium]|nr:hypothetical protein [Ignavibacteria bacterium]
MGQITLHGEFEVINCGGCGVTFALTSSFVEKRRNDHKGFYCPNGCNRYYPGKSDEEILKEKLAAAQSNVEYWSRRSTANYEKYEAEKRSKAAHKAHYTMLKRKVKKGQCPCCEKTFPDVAEHIKNTHPDYNKKMKVKK